MKKLVLFSSIFGIFALSGCATKYYYKCDKKTGVCVETLSTNSATVSNNIKLYKSDCLDNNCKKPVITKVSSKNVNINIIVKSQTALPKSNCVVEPNSYIDNY